MKTFNKVSLDIAFVLAIVSCTVALTSHVWAVQVRKTSDHCLLRLHQASQAINRASEALSENGGKNARLQREVGLLRIDLAATGRQLRYMEGVAFQLEQERNEFKQKKSSEAEGDRQSPH